MIKALQSAATVVQKEGTSSDRELRMEGLSINASQAKRCMGLSVEEQLGLNQQRRQGAPGRGNHRTPKGHCSCVQNERGEGGETEALS